MRLLPPSFYGADLAGQNQVLGFGQSVAEHYSYLGHGVPHGLDGPFRRRAVAHVFVPSRKSLGGPVLTLNDLWS
jgi:hypothetical protein